MIEKVTALILRENGAQKEVLTFLHPSAGRQLPAGTVEVNESPEAAVIREAMEETGLGQFEIVKKLGEQLGYTPEGEVVLNQAVRFYGWPAKAARRIGPLFTRGFRVQVKERKAGFAHVLYQEKDITKKNPKVAWEADGWLPTELLTREIKRHFYLLRTHAESKDSWPHVSDMGHTFVLEWKALNPRPELIGEQNTWLDYLAED